MPGARRFRNLQADVRWPRRSLQVGSGCTWLPLRAAGLDRGAASDAWALLLLVALCNLLLALLRGGTG